VIPLSVPAIHGNEWDYVKECLDTNWVSSAGTFVGRFEMEFAHYVSAPHAISAVNGTAALHLALLAAGVAVGDEVLVSDLTFIAPINVIRYMGAHPVLVDAESQFWQMDTERVAEFLEKDCRQEKGGLVNVKTGRRVSLILPVHILGHPVDMEPLLSLAQRFGLAVIEDATESLGARYQGKAVGTLSDAGCFSFNGNKLMTTGGGGMVVTANADWATRAKHLSTQAKTDAIEFNHDAVGYNYRLMNILAALGCAQLEQLDKFIAAKKRIAGTYEQAFTDVPGITPMTEAPWAESVFWMYTIQVDEAEYGMDSRALLRHLDSQEIQARPLWQPMHLSMPYADAQVLGGDLAEWLHRNCLCLPCSVGLSEDDQRRVIDAVQGVNFSPAPGI